MMVVVWTVPGVTLDEGQSGDVGDSRTDGSNQGAGNAGDRDRGLGNSHIGEVVGGLDSGKHQAVFEREVQVGVARGVRGRGSSTRSRRGPRSVACVGGVVVNGSGTVGGPRPKARVTGYRAAGPDVPQWKAAVPSRPAGTQVATAAHPETRRRTVRTVILQM